MLFTDPKNESNHWHVLRVLPRQDAKTARYLNQMGIEHYLPLSKSRLYQNGRVKKQEVPILSPYLFVRLAAKDRQQVFQAGTVMEFLRQNGEFVKLASEEVERIRRICKHDQEAVWSGRPVQVGDLVELISGALKGMRGIAVEEHGRWQMYVLIEALGQFVRFSIHRSLLRSLGTTKS